MTDLPLIRDAQGGGLYGRAVADLGDFDGDGIDDLTVGDVDSAFGGGGGAVWVLGGTSSPLSGLTEAGSLATLVVTGANDVHGAEVAGIGDINADGLPELAIGTIQGDGMANSSGVVLVYAGGTSGVVAPGDALWLIRGELDVQDFGAAITSGAIDGTAGVDLVVGAPKGPGTRGNAYVFLNAL